MTPDHDRRQGAVPTGSLPQTHSAVMNLSMNYIYTNAQPLFTIKGVPGKLDWVDRKSSVKQLYTGRLTAYLAKVRVYTSFTGVSNPCYRPSRGVSSYRRLF